MVAVTFFSTLCNAQDDAVAAPTGGRFHGGRLCAYAAADFCGRVVSRRESASGDAAARGGYGDVTAEDLDLRARV